MVIVARVVSRMRIIKGQKGERGKRDLLAERVRGVSERLLEY